MNAVARTAFAAALVAMTAPCRADGMENCGPQFLDEIQSGLESAGGVVGSSQVAPLFAVVVPAISGSVEQITVRGLDKRGCAYHPQPDFRIEGDDVDLGTLRGIVAVTRSVFLTSRPTTTFQRRAWLR